MKKKINYDATTKKRLNKKKKKKAKKIDKKD